MTAVAGAQELGKKRKREYQKVKEAISVIENNVFSLPGRGYMLPGGVPREINTMEFRHDLINYLF